ncbi:hypothetical protein [Tenuibacillus multivorans]|uniref:Uncharacterized protein n=1 Tax=Tenuibacillus multivorans TaxID=237069 RepID=A0A1H0AYU4_9BACI|nr:hypothetical protein [Tenuibacillus multivorans]GEL77606.1 hypothetical protein TMU01_18410 [Tenuibacillus multivorans]SDN38627.1 hypothetical protein SAMN05216498_2142 [Tenuibacillus multivorans]
MLLSVVILSWVGIIIYLVIFLSFQKLAKNNEFAFLHLLMVFMYALWLPLPIALNQSLDSGMLKVGTIFGLVYLIMLVISMSLQTGHISYLVKYNEDQVISEDHGKYMMTTLSNPFEGIANVFKSVWALCLAITFWKTDETLMALLMFLFSLLMVYFLLLVLKEAIVKPANWLSKIKTNPYIVNLETFSFFVIIIMFLTSKL